jgi:hypothetical protein
VVILVQDPNVPVTRSETFSGGVVGLFLLSFFALLYFSFFLNEDCLLFGLDGAAWRIMLNAQAHYRTVFTQTGTDPFQGSFDAWYPSRPEYLLPSALGLLFNGAIPSKAATYFGYGAFLLATSYALARNIGFDRPVALLGALLLPLLALPALVHSNTTLYGLFALNPHISQIVSLSVLMVTAFWALARRGIVATVILVFVPALCFMIATLGLIPDVVLMMPAVALYGGASLLDARSWRDDVPRLLAGLLLIVIPASLGTLQYFYGLVEYTAYNFFSAEFEQVRGSIVFASTLFGNSPLGRLAVPLGIIGAGWTALTETGRLRLFAITHLVATAAFLSVAVAIVELAQSYQGPSPVYFETCFWPYTLIFAAVAVVTAARLLLLRPGVAVFVTAFKTLSRPLLSNAARKIDAFPRLDVSVLVGFIILVAGFNVVQAGRKDSFCSNAGFNPSRPTAITEIIKSRIALEPGASFKGLAATIYSLGGKPSISWFDLHPFDVAIWRATGNDLRIAGLWQYQIPTLFQYFTFITPPYYLLLTEFLARPQDKQYRSVLVLTRMNETMLRLWGVRFVITDIDGGVSTKRNGATISLVELDNVNVGDFSPTDVQRVADFREGLGVMHGPFFDGRNALVTDAALDGPFVKANNVKLNYEKDGFSLRAISASRSILVLPIQYSHCWTISGSGQPGVFRADLMQLGVEFSGSLDAKLEFRYGPIFAGECRIEDLHDMARLRIQDARQQPAGGAR